MLITVVYIIVCLDLGLQATQAVIESEYSLKTLQDLSQNLPLQAKYITQSDINYNTQIIRSLSHVTVQKELHDEIVYNQAVLGQLGIGPADNILLLNGLILQEDDIDVFKLVNFVG